MNLFIGGLPSSGRSTLPPCLSLAIHPVNQSITETVNIECECYTLAVGSVGNRETQFAGKPSGPFRGAKTKAGISNKLLTDHPQRC